jgi:hypothetical protein
MRIVHLTPGSGRFYCENCLRDHALVRAMRKGGRHDMLLAPLYLPILFGNDQHAEPDAPIFFGGVNTYLQQKFGIFRRTPRWFDRLLDARGLLAFVGARARMTSPRAMGEMTLSMLQGAGGRQAKEVARLGEWLSKPPKPDVVCLSNALLLGAAGSIASTGANVACMLQDEDFWLDALPQDLSSRCWQAMRQAVRHVSLFVAPSRYFGELMASRLGIAAEKLRIIPAGIDPEPYSPGAPAGGVVGYLSRMCPEKGLATLAEALALLHSRHATSHVRLRVAGGMMPDDRPYVESIKRGLRRRGLERLVEFTPDLDRQARIDFLRSIDVLSVPTIRGEAMGLYILEAWACGVPVVQPRHGAFPELLSAGGGLLFEPNSARSLADALAALLTDADERARHARVGRQAAQSTYHIDNTASALAAAYQSVLDGQVAEAHRDGP